MTKTLKTTVTIKVTGCGCGSDGRPSLYSSFEIPDTGDAAINQRIAHRIMESKHGAQYECSRHNSSDYHFAFYAEPVGKWTGNEREDDGTVEYARKRMAEIEAVQPDSVKAHERANLDAEKSALAAWLVRVSQPSKRKKPRSKSRR